MKMDIKHLRLTALALLMGLLAVFTWANEPVCPAEHAVPLTQAAAASLLDEPSAQAATAAERHMLTHPAQGVQLNPIGQVNNPATEQIRPSRRTGGGSTPLGTAHPALPRGISHLIRSHFTLAHTGVAFISPRACDYYIFALRRILE